MIISTDEISKKRTILAKANTNLKKYFVGMDNIIDEVFSNIEVWYIMPELLTRPIIINLWGMTGVGKTDLIRRLIQELKYEEFYVEIQLDSGKSSGWGMDSIKSHIKNGGLTPDEPGIVFLDEIQRFRSIDEDGNIIDNDKFQDIWMLLSDGQFSDYGNQKRELEMMLLEILYSQDQDDDDDVPKTGNDTVSEQSKRRFKNNLWTAQMFKSELEIDTPLEEIMTMSADDKQYLVQEKMKSIVSNNKVRKYSKLLIFISGNLDEAYKMADDVSEVNIDADILHEFSKKINILDIKDSLMKKFKPEQIARFGNIHIIYPSLSKSSFKCLIERYLSEISKKTLELCGITLSFDENIYRAIYRNGVYPTQGTRPLFSTISSLIESPLPTFLFEALLLTQKMIYLSIDEKAERINGKIGDKIFSKKIKLQIDELTKKNSPNKLALVGAHESGHAVAYAVLFQLAPSQIVSDSHGYSNGFMVPHEIQYCIDFYLKKIQILLAGNIAEEIVFGKQNKTDGARGDLIIATNIAALMIRRYNMTTKIGCTLSNMTEKSHEFLDDIESSNDDVEQILQDQKSNAFDLLNENLELFKAVYKSVLEKRRLLPEEFFEIAKEFLPKLEIKQSNFVKSVEYVDFAQIFLNH